MYKVNGERMDYRRAVVVVLNAALAITSAYDAQEIAQTIRGYLQHLPAGTRCEYAGISIARERIAY